MSLNWGAVAVGALSGMGAGAIGAVPLVALGLAETGTSSGQAVLILVGFAAQFVAGYVAGRLSGRAAPANGGVAALGQYLVMAIVAITAGADPSVATLAFSAVVALVLGSAGAVLAASH